MLGGDDPPLLLVSAYLAAAPRGVQHLRQEDPGIADEADDQARLGPGTEAHQLEPADDIIAGPVAKPPEGEELGERLQSRQRSARCLPIARHEHNVALLVWR